MASYIWATVFVDHSSIITIFNFTTMAFIPVIHKNLIYDTYKMFRKIFIFFVTLSLIDYLFVTIGLNMEPNIIDPVNKLKSTKYIQYLFYVTVPGKETRFFSVFDEPGVLGTLGGLILVAERFNFKKKSNLIILLAGILSMSFYFYVVLLFGVVMFSRNTKYKKYLIAFIVIFVVFSYNNDFFYQAIWYRFEWDSEAEAFVGDNRTDISFDNFFESIKWTPLMFTGVGSRNVEQFSNSASLTLVIAKHGLIFCILNIGAFIILMNREIKNRRRMIVFMLFFIATLYQRPGFYSPHSIFLYSMVIYSFDKDLNTTTTTKAAVYGRNKGIGSYYNV